MALGEPYRPPVVTEMEDGPDRMRRASLTRLAKLSLRYLMSDAQMATFKAFVETTLNEGTQHFTMVVPSPGVTSGSREAWLDKGLYKATRAGSHWSVTFTLAVLNW